jgi:beta-glucosidase
MRLICWGRLLSAALVCAALAGVAAGQGQGQPEVERRINALLARMTLEEKVGQLAQYSKSFDPKVGNDEYTELVARGQVGSLYNYTSAEVTNNLQRIAVERSRLHIPLIFAFDVIHGFKTTFPIPLAEAGTWNPELIERAAATAAREASASGVRWTFGPMLDIARDPRWGRIAEGSGEDPFLGSAFAAARVRGFQGPDYSAPTRVVACPKHYAAYGAAEGGRDYNVTEVSEHTLREIYLPPFRAAVKAGAGTLMSAFNNLDGTPASANRFTLTEVLRGEWGFDGFVVSDWEAIKELINQGVAATPAEAARRALEAGVDMDMVGGTYQQELAHLVRDGVISEKTVDEAVRRVLRVKLRLGLFEHPYTDPARSREAAPSKESLELALEDAREAVVLLKNERDVLPLGRGVKTIAVVGPLADDNKAPLGPWAGMGRPEDVVTALAGIRKKAGPETKVIYAKGCDIEGGSTEGFAAAVAAARSADVVLAFLGEAAEMSGEAGSRAYLDLPGVQQQLLQALHETGKPVVLVLMNGRPLTIPWAAEHVPAIVEAWFLGSRTGDALADVLFGDYNPSGKLPVTFPRTVGQVPIYYNHANTGRPPSANDKYTSKYIDAPYTPQFPFGYGLSYTTFRYANLKLGARQIRPDGSIKVSAEVENTGARAGVEVVQLYIRDVAASLARPVRELKGFRRVALAPGERKVVEFTLAPEQLGFHDRAQRFVVEPGEFRVWVGPNSAEGLEGSFEVVK